MGSKRIKRDFFGCWLEPQQRRQLVKLSRFAGEPGNQSAGLRWLLDNVKLSAGNVEISMPETRKGEKAA